MKKLNAKATAAVAGALTAAVATASYAAGGDWAKNTETVKCYGVAEAGKNDCASPPHGTCQGSAKKDNADHAWIIVPKGVCDKIAGGSTEPKA